VNVLAIETSGRGGGVAACRDEAVLAEETLGDGLDHGRMLVSVVDKVVSAAGWDKRRDIDLVAVGRGPGSFTGIRVGLTCARTMALFLDRPLVAVCSLDAMVRNAPSDADSILAMLDAKRGDVYAAFYERADGAPVRVRGPELLRLDEALAAARKPVRVMGDGLRCCAMPPAEDCIAAPESEWRIHASVVARLALNLFKGGRCDDPLRLEPIYLRRPQAEEKREITRERGQP